MPLLYGRIIHYEKRKTRKRKISSWFLYLDAISNTMHLF